MEKKLKQYQGKLQAEDKYLEFISQRIVFLTLQRLLL